MDKLTEPPMILGMANSGFLLILATYFYKKFEEETENRKKIEDALIAMSKKLAELEKHSKQGKENFKAITGEIKTVRKSVKGTNDLSEKLNEISYDVNNMIQELNSQGFEVTSTSYQDPRMSKIPSNKRIKKPSNDFSDLIEAVSKQK